MDGELDAPGDVAWDLLFVACVGALLVGVHYLLPPDARTALAFDHRRPWSLALLTSSYVHTDARHLWSNVGGYLSVAVVTTLLCHLTGRRRWLRRTLLALLVALPVLVSLTSWAVLRYGYGIDGVTSYGFSGVVAGFGGFLLVALVAVLRPVYGREASLYLGEFVLVLLLLETYAIYAATIRLPVALLFAAGLCLPVVGLGRVLYRDGAPAVSRATVAFHATVAGLVALLLAALVFGLFPTRLVGDGTLTNVFAHAAGFGWGALLAVWTGVVTVD